jgi:hypothetical protein
MSPNLILENISGKEPKKHIIPSKEITCFFFFWLREIQNLNFDAQWEFSGYIL